MMDDDIVEEESELAGCEEEEEYCFEDQENQPDQEEEEEEEEHLDYKMSFIVMEIFEKVSKTVNVDPKYDVDFTDRLKYFYTPWMLVANAAFIFGKNYVGESVQCWTPAQFSGAWEQYVERYCLIENTYFVPMNDTNLPAVEKRENLEMRYYQWVPFILAIMAATLYIPRLFWRAMQTISGASISVVTMTLIKDAIDNLADNDEVRQGKIVKKYVTKRKKYDEDVRPYEGLLTLSLLVMKFLAIIVIIVQMAFLDFFMGLGPFFGYKVVADLVSGRQWPESGSFPRVTFCDVSVRELGQVQNWSLQCVLMVNMFSEKIFVFFWWWYLLMLVISFLNLIKWIFRLSRSTQINYIKQVLKISGTNKNDVSDANVRDFYRRKFKMDGCILLWLIDSNATIFQAAEFVRPLFEQYIHSKND
ncbi:hypothetical protein WR25_00304 isoform G [Diploscapter pachys]|uniref:Innexin n=2 Tax=Diploscapter pachys TaxID=2018661 RepID=A0A2A2J708_9BILA|nr:hypothetical protein WR25_00304 isoform A [Diploscapter pachys]PAV57386.1 hypothetical protein WR25_00304 isoform C [Diploscapter pachys]PAV57388.1 hypothetical protein WR25_00304 isoform E [Diploscapter pachys]PAV57390.1 hypothetical protein WR25_00304 isoform G [Diploscapter pachys]